MIARLVKMTFKPECLASFLLMFNSKKDSIRNFEGCTHLQLLASQADPNIVYTYSIWSSNEHLEQYRSSDLFAKTWKETKSYFSGKAEAISFDELQNV